MPPWQIGQDVPSASFAKARQPSKLLLGGESVQLTQSSVVAQVCLIDVMAGVSAKVPQRLVPVGLPHDAVNIDVDLQAVEEDVVVGA